MFSRDSASWCRAFESPSFHHSETLSRMFSLLVLTLLGVVASASASEARVHTLALERHELTSQQRAVGCVSSPDAAASPFV